MVAVAAFVGYVGLGFVGQEVVKASTGLSSFWPPNGLLVGLLVLLPSRLRLWVLVAVLPAELVLDVLLGYGSRGTLGWAAANLLESSLAAGIVLVVARGHRIGDRRRDIVALAGAAIIAPLFGGLIGGMTTHALYGGSLLHAWFSWWLGDGTGIFLVAPVVIALGRSAYMAPQPRRWMWVEIPFVVAVTTIAFAVAPTYCLFFVLAPLVLIAARHTLGATAVACLAFAVAAAVATGRELGPVAGIDGLSLKVTVLDAFIATAAFVCFLISTTISDLHAARRAVDESERRLAHALRAAEMGAWELDGDSGRMWRSPRHDAIFGYTQAPSTWSFETTLSHVVAADRQLVRDAVAAAPSVARFEVECRISAKDGRERWVRLEGAPFIAERGAQQISGTILDVTDRVQHEEERGRFEEQLRQSQKLEAVGKLAGGIAHEFNNLMTAVCGYSSLALSRIGDGAPKLRSELQMIAQSGERAADLTRQLLAYSGRQVMQPTLFDLNEAVADTALLLAPLFGADIAVQLSPAYEPCLLEADRGQIEQLLMNLAFNARDAMPSGGMFKVTTARRIFDPAEAAHDQPAVSGEHVVLTIADDGAGMDEATRARAFEPFFTTKPVGAGTGLGLASVFGTVAQCGGHITLTTEEGVGTQFEILLPAAALSTESERDSFSTFASGARAAVTTAPTA